LKISVDFHKNLQFTAACWKWGGAFFVALHFVFPEHSSWKWVLQWI